MVSAFDKMGEEPQTVELGTSLYFPLPVSLDETSSMLPVPTESSESASSNPRDSYRASSQVGVLRDWVG